METTDYEHGAVPQEQRKGFLSLTAVWIAIGIDLSGAFLGIELANGMEFWPAILAVFIGSAVLGLLAIATSYIGAVTGLSTAMISRITFGRVGGVLLSLVLSICLMGWFSVQAGFFGLHAQVSVAQLTGLDLPIWLMTGIGGVLMVLTALWGYRSISKLSEWAVPLMLALLLLGVVLAFVNFGSENLTAPTESLFGFGTVVSLVVSIFIMGVVISPDFARWSKSPKKAMGAGFVGFFVGNSIILVISIILAKIVQAEDLITIFFMLGLGAAAVVVLILAQWTTNTVNIYSTALSFSAIHPKLNRRTVTIVAGAVGVITAMLGAADYFISFLSAIGIIVAPFGGVYLATFYLDRGRARFKRGDARRTVEPIAIIAWIAGIFTALATARPEDGLGLGWFTLTSVSAIDGLIVGFVVYAAIRLIAGRNSGAADNADPAGGVAAGGVVADADAADPAIVEPGDESEQEVSEGAAK